MSAAKVELGRALFFDPRLSASQTQSCASCHHEARAFTEPRATSVGSTGHAHSKNAPSLFNIGYARPLTWANPLLVTLEQQMRVPLFGEHPVELGLAGKEDVLQARLEADPDYPKAFVRAFPEEDPAIHIDHVLRAIAAFERSLVRLDTAYDRFLAGEAEALSPDARRGQALFFSAEVGCGDCHRGRLLSDAFPVDGRPSQPPFHRLDPSPKAPEGLHDITARKSDWGRFRTPSLRGVGQTAPYLHDGSASTLEAALRAHPIALDDETRAALVAFLNAL